MNDIKNLKNEKLRSVRNLFLTYLFISLISERPGIFASICAAFPFVIPIVFSSEKKGEGVLAASLICGIPGVLAAVLYLLFFGAYSTANWIVPAGAAFSMCLLYTFIQKRVKPDKLVTARAVITVAVCFIAFV